MAMVASSHWSGGAGQRLGRQLHEEQELVELSPHGQERLQLEWREDDDDNGNADNNQV